MEYGKLPEAVLKRTVISCVNKNKVKDKKAEVGKDAGSFETAENGETILSSVATICGTERYVAQLAVTRAVNSLAAGGGIAQALTVSLTVSKESDEALIRTLIDQLCKAAKKMNIPIISGHTQIADVNEPVITVTAIGKEICVEGADTELSDDAEKVETDSEKKDERYLIMIGTAGAYGSAMLASDHREEIHSRYSYELIDDCARIVESSDMRKVAEKLYKCGITNMHDVAEGGVFGAAWEICERLGIGVEIDIRKIPIKQETVEVTEFFDINPYMLRGDGAMLLVAKDPEMVFRIAENEGFDAEIIGIVKNGNDRVIINEDEKRFLEPNRADDYYAAKQGKRMNFERMNGGIK